MEEIASAGNKWQWKIDEIGNLEKKIFPTKIKNFHRSSEIWKGRPKNRKSTALWTLSLGLVPPISNCAPALCIVVNCVDFGDWARQSHFVHSFMNAPSFFAVSFFEHNRRTFRKDKAVQNRPFKKIEFSKAVQNEEWEVNHDTRHNRNDAKKEEINKSH